MAFNKAKALASADKYIAKQNYNKALNELLKVAKVAPGDTNLLNKIGDLYSKTGNTQSATSYFLKVADSYRTNGFNLKAIAVYKKILRVDKGNMDARDQLVDLYMQQGHQSEAKGELRRMAEHYYSENLFSRALTCYQKMLEIDGSNLDARLKISEILVREGRRDEAAEHFCAMGNELLGKNLVHEAQKMISQGLKMAPDSVRLQILLARVYLAEGKTDEALHQLTETCRKNDQNLEAIKILGQTYLDRGQLREAKACFMRALHISAEETGSLEEVGRGFIEAGELDEAYSTLVPISENFTKQGKVDDAVRLFRNILYADENHLPSLEMLVQIYRENDQAADAILTLEKMIQGLMGKGADAQAAAKIQDLLALDPNNLEWRARLDQLQSGGEPDAIEADPVNDFVDLTGGEDSFQLADDENGISMTAQPEAGDLSADPSMSSMEPSDLATKIQNHLTEADVFMKYGIMDQALTHLNEVKEIEPFHIEANLKLRQIYQERQDTDSLIQCTVGLINGHIEAEKYHDALDFVKELEGYRPDIARIHRGRIESLLYQSDKEEQEERETTMSQYSLDFTGNSASASRESQALTFSETDADVVDFRELGGAEKEEPAAAGEDGIWSLDMPKDTPSSGAHQAEDLADMYASQVENPGEVTFDNISSLDFAPGEGSLSSSSDNPSEESSVIHFQDDVTGINDLTDITAEDLADEDLEELDDEDFAPNPPAAVDPYAEPATPSAVDGTLDESELLDEDALEDADFEPVDEPAVPPPAEPTPTMGAAATGGNERSLASELEEIDFFISVEAFEDAQNLLQEAHGRFGDHPLILERMQEVQAHTNTDGTHGMAIAETGTGDATPTHDLLDQDTGFFDLAAELSEELFDDGGEINDKTGQEEIQSVDELFEEFKRGVDEQISDDDYETHYDLGIAYKEMGLLEEAINEFRRAQAEPTRFLECSTLIGSCMIELGRTEDAIVHYEEALAKCTAQNEIIALKYEWALALQGLGELEKALALFMEIRAVEANYRDLESRIEALV
ncbi:tetratricopeptide repeat protein [Acanthopleuribacter pedis]|uniref:Tetratricopeptide repeat protein n=1 Tax=Acanthopleuribacter pedis TaxID=442870 RepID=A0A8J7QFW8_9BACT|nr:tetratricopeptide repeat protein [Acanthopleuribacter pedis]MBO1317813.1 tetratricopeptide repeat protein [Acanthopleuribacter pedis]